MTDLNGFYHGINLGGWLSQCNHTKQHYDTFICENDFKIIKDWGFDHVRIPVDYNPVQDKDGNFIESGFVYIQNAIENGAKEIDMISDVGYQHLDYIKYMRNWASAAHPNQTEVTGLQLISWLETCIREIINLPVQQVTVETGRFLKPGRALIPHTKDGAEAYLLRFILVFPG